MSGIQFPDLAQALSVSSAMRARDDEREYRNELLKMKREGAAQEQADAPHVAAALKGDRSAIDRVSPGTAMKLFPMLERMEAGQKAKLKEAADFTMQSGMAVLQAPPEQRAQAYGLALEEARRRGFDTASWPQQWTPQTEGWVSFNVNKARPVADYFKSQGGGLDPIPGQAGDPATAIGGIESGGRYDAVGPVANAQGHRAYGKYQVLETNIGPWTQEIIGRPMTPQEFLKDEKAQDAVFNAKFGQYVKQFGSREAAARAWFAGPGGMNNPNAKDVLGTTVQGYEAKFKAGMGGAPGAMPQGDGGPPGSPAGDPTQNPKEQVRGLRLPPGAHVRTIGGIPVVKNGTVLITGPDGKPDFVPLPQRSEPKEQIAPGYRWNADRSAQEFIPGGPADPSVMSRATEAKRRADEKAIPTSVTKGVQENLSNLKTVDKALAALEKYPGGVGGLGSNLASILPGVGNVQNRIDKEGTELRALIGDIGSLIIHDRSGAAVTAAEFPRLKPFIPTIADDPETARKKLAKFKATYEEIIRDTLDYYGPNNGFREYKPATEYINRDQPQVTPGTAPPPPNAAPAIAEGATATNPQTGAKIVFRGGQWVPQ